MNKREIQRGADIQYIPSAESEKNALGVYIHVPFCRSKCLYCDFYSIPRANEELIERYCTALISHIGILAKRHGKQPVSSVFFGGGTPTLLSERQFAEITAAIDRGFRISADAEITAEGNPATFDKEKLTALRSLGINRLSIGVQSAVQEELRLLGRTHSADDAKKAFDAARGAHFDNISIDLMYGLPSQTVDSFGKTLALTRELSPEHVSVYGLQLEEDTPLYRKREKYVFPEEDTEIALNRLALAELEAAGYRRYEISNYAREGFECRHNLKYWKRAPYLGVGAAAHSLFGETRYFAPSNAETYIDAITHGELAALELCPEQLSSEEQVAEYVMLRMRLAEGISPEELERDCGVSFAPYKARIAPFILSGHIKLQNGRYSFTPEGFDVSNTVLAEII